MSHHSTASGGVRPGQSLGKLENAGLDPDERLANRLGMQLNTFLKNFGRARTLLLDCLRGRGVSIPLGLLERGGH